MSHFCLLADAGQYAVSDVDLLADAEPRAYWIKLFEEHFQQVLGSAKACYGRTHTRQIDAASRQFGEALASLRADPPATDGPIGVVQLCRMREKALRDHGLHDSFRHVKQRENQLAVEQYPQLIRQLTALPAGERWERLIRGVFAGNIFDLGSAVTMGYADENVDFDAVMEKIKPRPWLVDDFDELVAELPMDAGEAAPWAKAVIFVDNAGADFVLGVMPLARQLAAHATSVVLAANELPSLNDITADETVSIVQNLADGDDELASYVQAGLFEVVSTGNDIPLIDLSEVSDELNAAAEDAELVVLEGMGRSVESNLHTNFAVDTIQLCLLKDPNIAARVNGEVFDCVCMYRPLPDE
jgi:type II pantothenate kinase